MKLLLGKDRHGKHNGFTLVELLVVIAIIGLLSTVAVVSMTAARIKARDTKRATTLKQIMTALELYNDNVGHYPITTTYACFDCTSYVSSAVVTPASTNLTTALAPYLPQAPVDPSGWGSTDQGYLYMSLDGINFKLFSWRRPENINNYGSWPIDPSRCVSILANGNCSSGVNTVSIWSGSAGAVY